MPFAGHHTISPESIINSNAMVEIPMISLPVLAPDAPSAFDFPNRRRCAALANLKISARSYLLMTLPVYWSTQMAAIAGLASMTL